MGQTSNDEELSDWQTEDLALARGMALSKDPID